MANSVPEAIKEVTKSVISLTNETAVISSRIDKIEISNTYCFCCAKEGRYQDFTCSKKRDISHEHDCDCHPDVELHNLYCEKCEKNYEIDKFSCRLTQDDDHKHNCDCHA